MQHVLRVPTTFTEIVLRAFLENNFNIFAVTKYGDRKLSQGLVGMFEKEENFCVVEEVKETHIFYLFWFFPIPISSVRYFKRAELVINEKSKIAKIDILDMEFGDQVRRKNLHALLPGNMLNLNFQRVDSAIEYYPASFYYDEDTVITHNPLT